MVKIAVFSVRMRVNGFGHDEILSARAKLLSVPGVKTVVHEDYLTEAENVLAPDEIMDHPAAQLMAMQFDRYWGVTGIGYCQ